MTTRALQHLTMGQEGVGLGPSKILLDGYVAGVVYLCGCGGVGTTDELSGRHQWRAIDRSIEFALRRGFRCSLQR